jgi:hypothetical protein
MTYEPMTIKLNTGEVTTRPYREAVSLLSRRLAYPVTEEEALVPMEPELPHVDPQTPVDSTDRTLEDLTKPELIELAKEHDLPVYGTKDDLIERITENEDQLSATTVDDLDDLVGATPEDVPGEDSDDSDGGN